MARSNGTAASILKTYPDEFLFCRPGGIVRHQWTLDVEDDPALARDFPASRSVLRVPKECVECHFFIVHVINTLTGDELRPAARRAPKGYYIKGNKGANKVTARDVRKEAARRLS
jgi:hypothetical protein